MSTGDDKEFGKNTLFCKLLEIACKDPKRPPTCTPPQSSAVVTTENRLHPAREPHPHPTPAWVSRFCFLSLFLVLIPFICLALAFALADKDGRKLQLVKTEEMNKFRDPYGGMSQEDVQAVGQHVKKYLPVSRLTRHASSSTAHDMYTIDTISARLIGLLRH